MTLVTAHARWFSDTVIFETETPLVDFVPDDDDPAIAVVKALLPFFEVVADNHYIRRVNVLAPNRLAIKRRRAVSSPGRRLQNQQGAFIAILAGLAAQLGTTELQCRTYGPRFRWPCMIGAVGTIKIVADSVVQ